MAAVFERLHPAGPPAATAAELLAEAALHERAGGERPHLFLNMVSTVDGRAAVDGRTGALGSAHDLDMLLALRAAADAVLIGTGTLNAEGYARLVGSPERRARRVAAGLAEDPPAVLISRRLAIRWDAGLFAAPEQPVLVYTAPDAGPEPPPLAARVEIVRLPDPTPVAVLADLHRRGVRALLCEGGPRLNRGLLAAGVVDELFLTITPMLTGDEAEPAIVAGGRLPTGVDLSLRWALRGGDDVFLRYEIAR
jgi:riboflavin biosynthesis pyrimidine reductase